MKQPPIHYRHCPECGARNDAAAGRCWLCSRPLTAQDEVLLADLPRGWTENRFELLFAVLTFAAAALSLLMILGTMPSQPLIAGYVAICAGPAFLAALVRGLGRKALGKPFSWQNTFVTFVMSVTVVLAIFGLLFIALVIMLFVVCVRNSEQYGP